MPNNVVVNLGIVGLLSILTGVALLIRRYIPRRYGDFWRIWGEPPHNFLRISAGFLAGSVLVAIVRQTLTQPILFWGEQRLLSDVILFTVGIIALVLGGGGLLWLFRKSAYRRS